MAKWGHASSEEPDRWDGAFDTREEAIEDGRETYGGETFWVQGGSSPLLTSLLPDGEDMAEYVINALAEQADGEAGESAADFPDVTREAKADLAAKLRAVVETWAAEHVKVEFWVAVGTPERIEPEVSR